MLRLSTMIALWFMAVILFGVAASGWRWSLIVADNERAGTVVHRILSQRADQHDAHMTSLSSLALTTSPPPREALLLVASNIIQFYPRIMAVDLVPLGAGEVISTRREASAARADLIRQVAQPVSQKPSLIRALDAPEHYLLVKRVPNSAAATHALALEIDAKRLADLDGTALSSLTPELSMPDGADLKSPSKDGTPSPLSSVAFERALGSASQPLLVRLRHEGSVAAVVPWIAIALFAIISALFAAGLRSFAAARMAERDARRHAGFREQEVRLAHGSRINAMGELSLGIAHELTQPLAAILSQSQAGLRLAQIEPQDAKAIVGVLEANVRHARRAGDILAKLRAWVSAKPGEAKPVDLNRVATDVAALTRAEFESRGLVTVLDLASPSPSVLADPVEFEQIIYNLATNAADACEPAGKGTIRIRTFSGNGKVGLEIRDDGPGFAADVLARVFEPFFTSKPDGMGLGLALCQRLVEKIGGQITASNHLEGGAVLTVLLPPSRAVTAPDQLATE